MRKLTLAILLATLLLAAKRRAIAPPTTTWVAALSASQTRETEVAGRRLASSSRLKAQWTALAGTDHYVVSANTRTFTTRETSLDLTGLASGTRYTIRVQACLATGCIDGDKAVEATTAEEYWQIRGTGSSFATAEKIVSDGNTKGFAIRWPSDAGASLAGRAQLYYDPISGSEKGVKIAETTTPANDLASLSRFTAVPGFGVRRQDGNGQAGSGPATTQVVPIGTKIRLYWEAEAGDRRGRIYSLDSQDGVLGRDFHPGTPTICQESDLAAGAPCSPRLLIGTDIDSPPNPKIRQARQFKIGYPTLDTWRWDEAPGTWMIFTAHLADATCSATFFNAGYAVWDGSRWNVQYDSRGCPKLIPGVQAPMPLHIGGTRYKVYFNNNASTSGTAAQTKPLKILYADGAATGDPSLVEFEDWETIDRAREVHVLWPSGAELTVVEESVFDDYQVWTPTNDPDLQIMYSNMTCPANACGPPFVGVAVLLNP